MSSTAPHRPSLAVVYVTVFLDLLGFGIILPSLPFFAHELGASGLGLGFLFTAYSLTQLFGAAVLGRLSDRLGRRPVLMASLFGSAVSMALSGIATSLWALCAARALAGLFGGSIATAQAYIADVTKPAERARYMGLLGASIGGGFVIGPALGAGLRAAGYGFAAAAFTAAVLAALNLGFASFALRESLPENGRPRSRPTLATWRAAARRAGLAPILVATFCTMFAFVGMETTFAFLGKDRFAMSPERFGLVLVFVGIVSIVVQGGLIRPLARRFGERRVATVGASTMAIALLALPFMPTLGWTLLPLALLASGQGLTTPTLSTLVSLHSGDTEQGTILGINQSLSAGARAFGPLIAGSLYDLAIAAPYVLGGALALIAGVSVGTSPEPDPH